MPVRTIAIGDIHGCAAALATVLKAVDPQPDDTIITLGDYVDRGDDVKGALDRLIALSQRCTLIPLLGNHDEMLLDIVDGKRRLLEAWLNFGGNTTLASYDCTVPEELPEEHVDFLKNCRPFYEADEHFYVHANYIRSLPLDKQPGRVLRWESLDDRRPGRHFTEKRAIVGHTSQKSGEVLDLGYLKCIDTRCYGEGWLTAMDVHTGQLWQADKRGQPRNRSRFEA
jgi:serine/threonine protein phosphatase 1